MTSRVSRPRESVDYRYKMHSQSDVTSDPMLLELHSRRSASPINKDKKEKNITKDKKREVLAEKKDDTNTQSSSHKSHKKDESKSDKNSLKDSHKRVVAAVESEAPPAKKTKAAPAPAPATNSTFSFGGSWGALNASSKPQDKKEKSVEKESNKENDHADVSVKSSKKSEKSAHKSEKKSSSVSNTHDVSISITPPSKSNSSKPLPVSPVASAVSSSFTSSPVTQHTSTKSAKSSSNYANQSAIFTPLKNDYQAVLKAKEDIIADLESQLRALKAKKSVSLEQQSEEFEQLNLKAVKSSAAIVSHWKAEVEGVKQRVVELEKQLRGEQLLSHQLTQDKEELSAQLQQETTKRAEVEAKSNAMMETEQKYDALLDVQAKSAQLIDVYRCLTGMEMTMNEFGTIQCKMENKEDSRVIEFDLLTTDPDELEYSPKKIDMNGLSYPDYLTDSLTTSPAMASKFMKIIMNLIFKKE